MKQLPRVALSASLLAGALIAPQFLPRGEAVPIRKSLDHFPLRVGDWHARAGTVLDPAALNILKATDHLVRRDEDGAGHTVWLFIAYWASQRTGAQVHSPKNCLPGTGWEPLEASLVTIPLPGASVALTANRYVVQKEHNQQVVYYWYQSQGKPIAGELGARIEMVRSSILRHRTDGALIRVSSPVFGSVQETSARLTRYVQALYPALRDVLPE